MNPLLSLLTLDILACAGRFEWFHRKAKQVRGIEPANTERLVFSVTTPLFRALVQWTNVRLLIRFQRQWSCLKL